MTTTDELVDTDRAAKSNHIKMHNKMINLKKPPFSNLVSVVKFEVFFSVLSSVEAVFQVNIIVMCHKLIS